MPTLAWIVVTGLGMSAIALTGSASLLLGERTVRSVLPIAVAFATGALLGAAMFHLLPAATVSMSRGLLPYVWLAGGFVAFYLLEQVLHWHHAHAELGARSHVGALVVIADGLHNLVDGVAVGVSFTIDVGLGLGAWMAVAVHEVPQEFGDFAVLREGGWTTRQALTANVVSALTFPLGGILAYFGSSGLDLTPVLAFAAGNFVYIAAADLTPQLTAHRGWHRKLADASAMLLGLGVLFASAMME